MKIRHLVFALAILLFFWKLGGHDVWAPDEPYFAEGAREMVADGQWAVPHVNGFVTTDKPPLFFWLIAVLSLPGGAVTSLTARLPSALAALCTLFLVMRLGRRMGGERVAWIAGVVLATTFMFWNKARWCQIDSLLCLLIWVALSAFEAWRSGDADGRRAGWLFWLAAALAVIAKGPVGMLLPLGIALVTLAFDRNLKSWRLFAPWTGPLLFFSVVAGWMVLATVGGGGEYSVWGAFKEHALNRAVHGMHHKQPPWYYLEVIPVQFLPWTGLLPGAIAFAWKKRGAKAERFLLVAAFFVVAFFSISTEKRDLYILPAIPAVALLLARFVGHLLPGGESDPAEEATIGPSWLLRGQLFVGALLALVGMALPIVARSRDEAPFWMALALGVIFFSAGALTVWACRMRRFEWATFTPAGGVVLALLFAVTFVYPIFEPVKSSRAFALRMKQATAESRAAGHRVVAYHLDNLPEAFAFHSDGVYTVETKDPAVIAEHFRQPAVVWAVLNEAKLDEIPDDVRKSLEVVHSARYSRKDLLLVRNQPARVESAPPAD